MIKWFCFIGLISLSISGYSQKPDCSSVHIGEFKLVDSGSGTTNISRDSLFQTEINDDIGLSVKCEIQWKDECTYTLRIVEFLHKDKPPVPVHSSSVMTVQIIEVNEDSYLQRTTSSDGSFSKESEVFILH